MVREFDRLERPEEGSMPHAHRTHNGCTACDDHLPASVALPSLAAFPWTANDYPGFFGQSLSTTRR